MSELPKFKSDVSRRWAKKFAKTFQRATQIENKLMKQAHDGMSVEEKNALLDAKDTAIEQLDELGEQQILMIAEVVESIPAEWLEADAPDNLDWSDPESYDYILQSKYMMLVQMIVTGEAFKEAAKN